jgi:hypothetical protein
MINPYGTDPLLAAFLGAYLGPEPGPGVDVTTRSAYACVVTRLGVGAYVFRPNTPLTDSMGLFQIRAVGSGGVSLEIDPTILYANSGTNVTINFTSNVGGVAVAADPTGLFSIALYDCADGVHNVFGNP